MKTISSLVLLLVSFHLHAQEISKAELKEYFLDGEFFLAQEEYADALYDFQELYKNGYSSNANINYRIGICYLNLPGQKDRAIPYLEEAVRNISKKYRESSFKQISAPADAYLYLGNAYRVNNRLEDAIKAYTTFKEISTSPVEIQFADQQIMASNTALRFMEKPVDVRFTNLGDSINGNSSNYKAVVSGDGKTMVYMNELPFYEAIYYSSFINGNWSAPINITPQIGSDGDQYVSSISWDGRTLYLTKEDPFNSDIYTSEFRDGVWQQSRPVSGTDINTKYWESHASVSKDGKTLYFTSNRRDGLGNMDIYKSTLLNNGQWSEPVNLGNVINTALNEDTPFITENDSILFFCSQGHETMGGYDIFMSSLGPNGTWGEPVNLGYPVSTTDDDLFYYPWHDARIGYVSLYREEGFGNEDIYAVQPSDDKALLDLLAELVPGEPAGVAEELSQAETGRFAVPVTGQQLPPQPEEKPTTPASLQDLQTPAPTEAAASRLTPAQATGKPPRELLLNPVYFSFDGASLNEAGKDELRKLYTLLDEFPLVQILLVGHADAMGPADYNLKLSERRAQAAYDFLVSLGAEKQRMTVRGLGETNFAAINTNADGSDNPEGRKLNRRVEAEVRGLDESIVIIIRPSVPDNLKYRNP